MFVCERKNKIEEEGGGLSQTGFAISLTNEFGRPCLPFFFSSFILSAKG